VTDSNGVQEHAIEILISELKKLYEKEMQLPLTAYIAEIESGTIFAS